MTTVETKLTRMTPVTRNVMVAFYKRVNGLEIIGGRYMTEVEEYFVLEIPEGTDVVLDVGRVGIFKLSPTYHRLYVARVITERRTRIRIGGNLVEITNLEMIGRY